MSVPLSSSADSADAYMGEKSMTNRSKRPLKTYWGSVLHVAEASCALELLARPSHVEYLAVLHASYLVRITSHMRRTTDLAKQRPDEGVVGLLGEVGDIQG